MRPLHLFLFFLLMAGCKGCDDNAEPENKKPLPTTDGRNTFYCEINGKPYYQKFVGGQPSYPTITGSYTNDSIFGGIDFRVNYYEKGSNLFLNFYGLGVTKIGRYKCDTTIKSFISFYRKDQGCSYASINRTNSQQGVINLSRVDFSAGIFSGTFEFKNWLPDSVRGSCDTIKITNGIFDIKL